MALQAATLRSTQAIGAGSALAATGVAGASLRASVALEAGGHAGELPMALPGRLSESGLSAIALSAASRRQAVAL